MDEVVTLNQQFKEEVGAVILMNKFNVNPGRGVSKSICRNY